MARDQCIQIWRCRFADDSGGEGRVMVTVGISNVVGNSTFETE